MDTDALRFIENIQINFDYTKWYTTLLIALIGSSYCPATLHIIRQQNVDTTQPNVSPDIASLFAAGDVSRGDRPSGLTARRNVNGCFRRLPLTIFLATDKPSPVPKQFSIQT